jgi:multiple sugar transport system permease protein
MIEGARWRTWVFFYVPMALFLVFLLFPFYWMGLTAIKPDEQLLDLDKFNPFWTWSPTFKHIYKLLFQSYYPHWLWNTMYVAVCATVLSIFASVLAAYAIVRLRYRGAHWVGGLIFLSYLVPPSILFIPLATVVFQYGLFDSPLALILTYPTILIPFSTWLLMGYFKTIPFELEECALIDGASRWQILVKIVLPLATPALATLAALTFLDSWNNFLWPLIVVTSTNQMTLPLGLATFQGAHATEWPLLMAANVMSLVPVLAIFFLAQRHFIRSVASTGLAGT